MAWDTHFESNSCILCIIGSHNIHYTCTQVTDCVMYTYLWKLEFSNHKCILASNSMMKCATSVSVEHHEWGQKTTWAWLLGPFLGDNVMWNKNGGVFTVEFVVCVQVKVTRRESPDSAEITIRELQKGDFFGEKALLGWDTRQARNNADRWTHNRPFPPWCNWGKSGH